MVIKYNFKVNKRRRRHQNNKRRQQTNGAAVCAVPYNSTSFGRVPPSEQLFVLNDSSAEETFQSEDASFTDQID